jgi:hypothetical protein
VVLRAAAIVLIIGTHAGLVSLQGGAHVLLAIAGYNYARFALPGTRSSTDGRRRLAAILRIAVPSVLWLLAQFLTIEGFSLPKLLLLNGYLGTGLWEYWYVEVIVQTLVLFAFVFSIPAARALERRRPFAFPAVLLVAALAVRFDLFGTGLGREPMYRTDTVLWLFLIGWLAQRASSPWHRALISLVIIGAVPGFFDKTPRAVVVAAGLLVLVWIVRVPVPRPVVRVVGVVAAASLWIYLTQWPVLFVLTGAPPLAVAIAAVAVGIAAWWTWERAHDAACRVRDRRRAAPPGVSAA